ncbi:MAG: FAD-binding oxidoreductase [Candidatus Acidiferrales bacterium]|jgi:glycolate oxidase FAD binding subunit
MNGPSDAQLARLEQLLGAARTTTDSASLAAYEVDGLRPGAAVRPSSAAEVAEVVRLAAAEKLAVILCSGRSKLAIGGVPARYHVALDLSGMNRVLAYDPGDLTLGVEPGVRLEDLQRELAQRGQFLPLEVAYSERATVGGAIAANSYSPLRASFGSARDFVLGMEFVTGAGEIAKSGGRVVKNVSGYDLHKLLIGSLGTLAVITRVNFRTFPRPAELRAFIAAFAGHGAALEFCRTVANSPLEPRVFEVLNPVAAEVSGLAAQFPAHGRAWSVAISAAGSEAVVARHARDLERMTRAAHATHFETLTGADAAPPLRVVREFVRLALEHSPAATIIRIAILPASAGAFAERVVAIAAAAELDAALTFGASGTAYVALLPRSEKQAEASETSAAAAVTQILKAPSSDGDATRGVIEWCPTRLKRRIALWGEPREDFALMQRVKNVFDPHGILSPGRFCGGL